MLSGVSGVLLGCSGSGDTTDLVSLSPTQAFWAIRLDKHAVNLALTPPYDTVRLIPHILNAMGTPLPGVTGQVRYSFADSSVTVDSTGLLKAHYVTGSTQVIASFTAQGITLSDAVVVQVTDVPPLRLTAFSLYPIYGGLYGCSQYLILLTVSCMTLAVTATDINDNTVPLVVHFTSADEHIATIDQSGAVAPTSTGKHVELYAETWAYGIAQRDSFRLVIEPLPELVIDLDEYTPVKSLTPYLRFDPEPIYGTTVVEGGTVQFFEGTATDIPFDVVFDDSTAVTGCLTDSAAIVDHGYNCNSIKTTGNIPPTTFAVGSKFENWAAYVRIFRKPGVYKFHSRLYPRATGVIRVLDSLNLGQ